MNLSRQEDPLLLQVHEPLGRAEVRRRDDTTLKTKHRQNRPDRPDHSCRMKKLNFALLLALLARPAAPSSGGPVEE